MKKLFSALLFVFVLGSVFGDDAPQVYYSSPSQKPQGVSGGIPQTSGMDQLKMKKIDDLQEMSAHHFGKLEEIQHQLAMLDQKISGLVESIKTHQEALKRMEQNQVKNQPRDQEKIKEPKGDAQNLATQSTVAADNQVKNISPTQSVSDAKEPIQAGKVMVSNQNDKSASTAERAHQSKPGNEIKKPSEIAEGAVEKKEIIEKRKTLMDPEKSDKEPLKMDLSENSTQEKKAPSPEDKYKKIRAMILQGNYKQSREELMEFIEEHPNHFLLPSAYYWLGETYFVEKQYSEAAKTFMQGYKINPTSHKVNDILLKLAMSLAALGKKQDACKTYKKLRNSEVAVSSTHKHIADREEKKLGCA